MTSIAWTGRYQDPINNNAPVEVDDFTIAVYADDGGSPADGRLLAEFNVGNEVNRTATDRNFIFAYEADIDFLMEAGVRYWVSLRNNTPDDPASFQWLVDPDLTNNVHFSSDGGATWLFQGQQADFRLTGITADAPLEPVVVPALASGAPTLGAEIESRDATPGRDEPPTAQAALNGEALLLLLNEVTLVPTADSPVDDERLIERRSSEAADAGLEVLWSDALGEV